MGEAKILGYIIIAGLFLSAIVMPLVEMFFVYRERLILSDALYNSCRTAAQASYNYADMRNIDAVHSKDAFVENFADTFSTSFGLNLESVSGNRLTFRSGNDAYNNFTVELDFYEYQTPYYKTATRV